MDKQAMFAVRSLSFFPSCLVTHTSPTLALTHRVFYRAPFIFLRRSPSAAAPLSSRRPPLSRINDPPTRRSFSSKLVLLFDDVYILFFFPQDVAPCPSPRYNVLLRRPSTTTSLSILRSSLHRSPFLPPRQCRSPFLTLAARVQSGVLIALTLHESG